MPAVKPLRVGLLGWSGIARRRFVPALPGSGCAVLTAIGSRGPAADRPAGVPVVRYEELLDRPDVELIYNSLPNHLHEEWTGRALAAGKHVLCEKPMGLSPASVERMIEAARAHGRVLLENLMFLQHPQHAVVRQFVQGGGLGELTAVRSVFTITLTDPANHRFDPACGGGACADLLVYGAGTAGLFLDDELTDLCGFCTMAGGVDVTTEGSGRTRTGQGFSFVVSFQRPYECAYELIGTRGKARLERAYTTPPDTSASLTVQRDGNETIIALPTADHFAETVKLVARHVADPSLQDAYFKELRQRHRLLAQIRQALKPLHPDHGSSR